MTRSVRTLTVVGLLVASTFVAPVGGATASGAPMAESGDCATVATLVKADMVQPNGAVAPDSTAVGTYAQRYTYQLDGNLLTEVQPPAGWKPVGATDEELRTYGFPDRPTEAAALGVWNDEFSSWKSNYTSAPCDTGRYNTIGKTTFHNYSWAGGFNINGTTNTNTYWDSQMHFTEPSFASTCANSGYAIWSGLGGWNNNNGQERLIQAGTDTTTSYAGGYLFWEVLTNIHQNPEVRGATVAPGDVVYTDASHSVVFNTVSASAYDATTGVLDASGNLATYAGVAANTYYDGSTSDYITEAPSNASGVVNLRKPSTGSVSIPWINVNDLSLNSFASDKILQDSSANPGTEEQTTTFDGAHGWSDTWHSCH